MYNFHLFFAKEDTELTESISILINFNKIQTVCRSRAFNL
jgi:hypothetical protein